MDWFGMVLASGKNLILTGARAIVKSGSEMIVSLTKPAKLEEAVARTAMTPQVASTGYLILSFDVEEHHRIEAANGLTILPALQVHYQARLAPPTIWLLEHLEQVAIKATFFVVGQV